MPRESHALRLGTLWHELSPARRVLLFFLLANAVGAGIYFAYGLDAASNYAAGYLLEQSLSVDNLVAFIVLFRLFRVPIEHQGRVLQWGVVGAALMRGICIAMGAAVLRRFRPLLLGCACFLLFSAYKLFSQEEDGDADDESRSPGEGRVAGLVRRVLPVSEHFDGDRFFTVAKGKRVATPLLLVLVVIELTDLVFAVDSIPAVFGVTSDPLVIWTSNIMAILGLRALYALLAEQLGALSKHLNKPVAAVLCFVGGKIIAEFAGGVVVGNGVSLLVIVGILGVGGIRAAAALRVEPGGGLRGAGQEAAAKLRAVEVDDKLV